MSETPAKRAAWVAVVVVAAGILGFISDASGLIESITGKSIHDRLSAGGENGPRESGEGNRSGQADESEESSCNWAVAQGGKNVGLPPTRVPAVGTAVLTVDTNRGHIVFKVDRAKTPCAVASLAFLSSKGYFNNSKCHRVVNQSDFKLLQCGDPLVTGAGYKNSDGDGGPGYKFAEENLPTGLVPAYPRGTVAMARTVDPATTGSQFFIALTDLNLPADYTRVGEITEGINIVNSVVSGGNDGAFEKAAGGGHPNLQLVIKKTSVS